MQAGNVVHRRGLPKGVHIPHAWQWLPRASQLTHFPLLSTTFSKRRQKRTQRGAEGD